MAVPRVIAFSIVAVTTVLALLMGIYIAVVLYAEDPTLIVAAAAATGAVLAALVTAEIVRNRRG